MRTPTLDDRLRLRERPDGRAAMYQSWQNLLFLHWRVDPERIQRTLPKGLYVDTFDGTAYVGIVPFEMRNTRPWWSPPLPRLSNFLELNVRTYVHDEHGTPGVWFYSLDCNQPLAVWGARKFFHLPYRHARMSESPGGGYSSHVRDTDLHCELSYQIAGNVNSAAPGTLEFFLVERYLLFAAAEDGRIFTGQVHHRPYPLAERAILLHNSHPTWDSNLLKVHDFQVDERTPEHICGTPGVDVEVFALQELGAK